MIKLTMENEKESIIKIAEKLIAHKSTKKESAGHGLPFGKDCANCLDEALKICESMGFRTKNLDGYAGYAEIGNGNEILGILTHLDVVPVGDGWNSDPFKLTIKDDKVYGRGILDDKGPAAIIIQAMKLIAESDLVLNKRVRLIFGLDEESDWEDMDHYKEQEEFPTLGFTPDADFPVINGEKGILNLDIRLGESQESYLLAIKGGNAYNSVPDSCQAVIMTEKGEEKIEVSGKSAHASTPELGENAISKMMKKLNKMEEDGIVKGKSPLVKFYNEKVGQGYNGEKMSCDFSDDVSGPLTFNVGMIDLSDSISTLKIDIRVPVTIPLIEVTSKISEVVGEICGDLNIDTQMDPIYIEKDNSLVKSCLESYEKITGNKGESIVIGGGTYARAMDNIVAFGPLFPHREDTAHQNNEYMTVDDLMTAAEIYLHAIIKMAT